eukprot:749798-Hanusia_phi.AAC.11
MIITHASNQVQILLHIVQINLYCISTKPDESISYPGKHAGGKVRGEVRAMGHARISHQGRDVEGKYDLSPRKSSGRWGNTIGKWQARPVTKRKHLIRHMTIYPLSLRTRETWRDLNYSSHEGSIEENEYGDGVDEDEDEDEGEDDDEGEDQDQDQEDECRVAEQSR